MLEADRPKVDTMTLAQVEQKLAALETEINELKRQAEVPQRSGSWYVSNSGQFQGDSVYDEIVRRGRRYRESLRPKARRKKRR